MAMAEASAEKSLLGMSAAELWPNRRLVTAAEAAAVLECTERHVLNLIALGQLGALDISTGANCAPGTKARRQSIRIPAVAWDKFIAKAHA